MDHAAEVTLLERLLALREARTTSMAQDLRVQSTDVYSQQSHHDLELERLFRDTPLVACLSADLPRPGDFVTVELGATPALVVRSESAEVRAFLNACRHRGARVADGRGSADRVFRCPYHAWVYDLDGRLLGHPLARDGFAGLDTGRAGLIELPALEAGGLVLVGPTPDTPLPDPGEVFDGLGPELASHGFEHWAPVGERDTTWRANWKLPVETFLETYHIFSLHRDSLAKEVLSTPMLSEFFGVHGRGVLAGRAAADLPALPRDRWAFRGHANLVYWLFPNTVLSLPMTGHAELWTFHPGPTPQQCRVVTRFYAPEEPRSEKTTAFWARMVDFTMTVVESEDFAQQVAIQRSVDSGVYPQRIFGRNEPALIHFHESLDGVLGAGTAMTALLG